jgi:hypothetical protein
MGVVTDIQDRAVPISPTTGRAIPAPGQIVAVRSRHYLVEEVTPPPEPWQQTLVRLSCLDDDAQGNSLQVLWEKEVDARILDEGAWRRNGKRGFDPPERFAAYLSAIRWNCVTSTNPRLFQAPFRAGIDVTFYQLEPLRKALALPRVNLFIADDVGLGKTIEAGLILRELLMRQKVRRVVVSCPASMLQQWQDELEDRFGLTFVIYNRDFVARTRRERGYATNPWTTHSRFLISHSLLGDESYAGPLREWLGDFCPGSMLILDEAHNAAPSSGVKYGIDSGFTRAVRGISGRFEHRLFLSATPHNGHSNSFSALLEILDPQRFCRGVKVTPKARDTVMVRRLKSDLREIGSNFPKREVVPVPIKGLPADAPELRLAELLGEYAELREERLKGADRKVQVASGLVISHLQKRLLSSIEAFALTLRVHRRTLAKQAEKAAVKPAAAPAQLNLLREAPGADDDRADLPEEDVRAEEESQVESATAAAGAAITPKEQALLDEMTRIAEEARGVPDPRVRYLIDWIRKNMCPGLPEISAAHPPSPQPRWNDRRLLIFTEYVDTKRYLEQQLRAVISATHLGEQRVRTLQGGDSRGREEIKQSFNADPELDPLRILIATDAAREGLNLQNYCADLFHFDLPWNPSRMEQRNGRIDRKLQRADVVRCHYFVFTQRPEDRVLEVLLKKTKTIFEELGSLTPVLQRRLNNLQERGIKRRAADATIREIEAEDPATAERQTSAEELEETRERGARLNRQLGELETIFENSKRNLGFEAVQFRHALSESLRMLDAPALKPLEPIKTPRGKLLDRWEFPALDRRAGADPTWADSLDALRPPRQQDQKFWEWRRASKLRPVVFDDTGTIDNDVVHLHLEHRIARRLLGRFLAQGFVHHDLFRACALPYDDPFPRVVLFGRLSLYGANAARLHDELVAVSARWTSPKGRPPLQPYSQTAEQRLLDQLEKVLLNPDGGTVPPRAVEILADSVDQDAAELAGLLQERCENLRQRAIRALADRAEREARDMAEILELQRKRIATEAQKYDQNRQLEMQFDQETKRQREADYRHWQRRLDAIEHELSDEPARIRASYEVKATRVEPVGIVYLWPSSM